MVLNEWPCVVPDELQAGSGGHEAQASSPGEDEQPGDFPCGGRGELLHEPRPGSGQIVGQQQQVVLSGERAADQLGRLHHVEAEGVDDVAEVAPDTQGRRRENGALERLPDAAEAVGDRNG